MVAKKTEPIVRSRNIMTTPMINAGRERKSMNIEMKILQEKRGIFIQLTP